MKRSRPNAPRARAKTALPEAKTALPEAKTAPTHHPPYKPAPRRSLQKLVSPWNTSSVTLRVPPSPTGEGYQSPFSRQQISKMGDPFMRRRTKLQQSANQRLLLRVAEFSPHNIYACRGELCSPDQVGLILAFSCGRRGTAAAVDEESANRRTKSNSRYSRFFFCPCRPKRKKLGKKKTAEGKVSRVATREEGSAPSTCATWRWGFFPKRGAVRSRFVRRLNALTHGALPLCATHFIFPHRPQTPRRARLRRSPRASGAQTKICTARTSSENSPSPHEKRKRYVRTSFRGYIYPFLGEFWGAWGTCSKKSPTKIRAPFVLERNEKAERISSFRLFPSMRLRIFFYFSGSRYFQYDAI